MLVYVFTKYGKVICNSVKQNTKNVLVHVSVDSHICPFVYLSMTGQPYVPMTISIIKKKNFKLFSFDLNEIGICIIHFQIVDEFGFQSCCSSDICKAI